MSQEIELECFRLIEEHDIDVSELPEKVQRKIEQLEEVINEFNDCESDSDEERDCELKMEAMDSGICKDLEAIVAKMKAEEADDNAISGQAGNGGQTNQGNSNATPPPSNEGEQNTSSDSPSWRFWM
jgi:hypothetical protein